MNRIEAQRPDRLEELVDGMFTSLFGELTDQEKVAIDWANQALENYNSLPKGNNRERSRAGNVALYAGRQLLVNPQSIDIARIVWNNHRSQEEVQDNQRKNETFSFYDLVKQEAASDIRKNWEKVTPEQLGKLVKIYASNSLAQAFAKDALTSYFEGPRSKRQRIDAFYNFTFSILDLVGDRKALKEGLLCYIPKERACYHNNVEQQLVISYVL